MAIKLKKFEILEHFCNCGIKKINFYINSQGHNPLTYAASTNYWEAVNLFSGRGMLTDVEDLEGKTVFVRALLAN